MEHIQKTNHLKEKNVFVLDTTLTGHTVATIPS